MSACIKKIFNKLSASKEIENPFFGAPWIGANIDLLGRYETDKLLVARYEPEWDKEKRSRGYRGLAGSERAWCILRVNADFRKVGIEGTNDPAAASLSKWGVSCPFWFGSALPIEHRNGGRHACNFLYWIDEVKKLAATLDGNRDNRFAVFVTDLSGKADKLRPGPRWPKGHPDGREVPMKEVLAKYPFLTVAGSGTRTT